MIRFQTVYVVDDNAQHRMGMVLMLKAMGFPNVVAFATAEEALDRMPCDQPDLIVSDWNMEPMSGLDFLRRLRGGGCRVPFLMVTAEISEDHWRQAIAAGASEFLFKPLSFADFRDAVECVLGIELRAGAPMRPFAPIPRQAGLALRP